MPDAQSEHQSVLLNEIIGFLDLSGRSIVIDATLGLGGHSEAVLETFDNTMVIGIDQDGEALKKACKRLALYGPRFIGVHSNFAEIARVAHDQEIAGVDAIVADLGVSSMQLDDPQRGFSFRFDAPLDMRMNVESGIETAADLLETLSEEEIANLIYRYGEERKSRRIARAIVARREKGEPVRTTGELAKLIESAVGRSPKDKIHPATRTFQALRIAVNDELGILDEFVDNSVDLLKPEGTLCIITFHSLEDRIVKQAFRKLSGKCFCPPRIPRCVCGAVKRVEVITRKPVTPTEEEVNANPRSRSAKLRVCRKLAVD
jgi:16S rRNA (cytosine1402-N4)-methyltransferase